MSPPSSGGTHIVQILNAMENADIRSLGFGSSRTIHIMAEAMGDANAILMDPTSGTVTGAADSRDEF